MASNSDAAVEKSSRAAYALYDDDRDGHWEKAISMLAKELKGVGPATASLLLSVYDSDKVPFFSDELFRWVMFEERKGLGWDRKIRYSIGEYKTMFPLVRTITDRLNEEADEREFSALDVEKVAYVLGRRMGKAESRKKEQSDGQAEVRVEKNKSGAEGPSAKRRKLDC